MRYRRESLQDLIAPLTGDEFFASYWEKTYLHLHNEPDRFSDYFSSQDIDRWLTSVRSGSGDSIILVPPEGSERPFERYRPEDVSLDAVYAALAGGCSLTLHHIEDWPRLQGLVKALSKDFHAAVGVSAYLSPKGGRASSIRTDKRDTFILQLEGERVWYLHEFSLLQIDIHQRKHLKFPKEWYGRTRTPQLAEVRLKPGDLLFIPRGMPRHAVAKDRASLHLNIGVTTLYWTDFLRAAVECVAVRSQALRRALPPGYVGNEEICERMRDFFPEVMKEFRERISFDEVLATVKRDRVAYQGFPSDGHFAQLVEPDELTADSEVERRPDVLCLAEALDHERNPKSAIRFGAQQVTGPLHLRRALDFICAHERFRVSELPGLDEKGQLTLVRRLIREGVLRHAATAKPAAVAPAEPATS